MRYYIAIAWLLFCGAGFVAGLMWLEAIDRKFRGLTLCLAVTFGVVFITAWAWGVLDEPGRNRKKT